MAKKTMSPPASASLIPPPGAGVPIKVNAPTEVDEGTALVLSGLVDCSQSGSAVVELELVYSDSSDWKNAPVKIAATGPLDAKKCRSFTVSLIAKVKSGSLARVSTVCVVAKGFAASSGKVAHIKLRPKH